MKDLSRTITRILKIDPELGPQLIPIRNKAQKYPWKNSDYWKQFLTVLNAQISTGHPKRDAIQKALLTQKRPEKKIYTFEPPTQTETVLGVIPEHLELRLKKYDRMHIDIAKNSLVSRLTHNTGLMITLARDAELLEIKQRQIWADLKDHFNLWNFESEGPVTFLVRKKDNLLILTSQPINGPTPGHAAAPPPPSNGEPMPESFVIRMDPDMLRKFFKFFNITPPPGLE